MTRGAPGAITCTGSGDSVPWLPARPYDTYTAPPPSAADRALDALDALRIRLHARIDLRFSVASAHDRIAWSNLRVLLVARQYQIQNEAVRAALDARLRYLPHPRPLVAIHQ